MASLHNLHYMQLQATILEASGDIFYLTVICFHSTTQTTQKHEYLSTASQLFLQFGIAGRATK